VNNYLEAARRPRSICSTERRQHQSAVDVLMVPAQPVLENNLIVPNKLPLRCCGRLVGSRRHLRVRGTRDHIVPWKARTLGRALTGWLRRAAICAGASGTSSTINAASKNRRNYWINDQSFCAAGEDWFDSAQEMRQLVIHWTLAAGFADGEVRPVACGSENTADRSRAGATSVRRPGCNRRR